MSVFTDELCRAAVKLDFVAIAAFIAAGAALYGAWKSADTATRNHKKTIALEVAKLREKQFYDLRNELAEFCTAIVSTRSNENNRHILKLYYSVALKLDQNDEKAFAFETRMTSAFDAYSSSKKDHVKIATQFSVYCQEYLDAQWKELIGQIRAENA